MGWRWTPTRSCSSACPRTCCTLRASPRGCCSWSARCSRAGTTGGTSSTGTTRARTRSRRSSGSRRACPSTTSWDRRARPSWRAPFLAPTSWTTLTAWGARSPPGTTRAIWRGPPPPRRRRTEMALARAAARRCWTCSGSTSACSLLTAPSAAWRTPKATRTSWRWATASSTLTTRTAAPSSSGRCATPSSRSASSRWTSG
mmetsp:Transcript_19801/g.60016  ORF Transcript_19801/g.60016 Transcript_19801/m.60016 type:complete len:201 (+) Transcript_19801:1619-2221(+)